MILQITHNDLDGLVCTVPFVDYADEVQFISYETKMEVIQRLVHMYQPDITLITDVGIRDHEATILHDLSTYIIFIDHHRNNGVQPSDNIIVMHDSGDNCGADLCFKFMKVSPNKWLYHAHDYDLWINKDPQSAQLAGIIDLLGAQNMLKYLPHNPNKVLQLPLMQAALQEVETILQQSLQLANDTRIDCEVNNIPLTVCAVKGEPSRVGNILSEQDNSVVVMIDLARANAISLRTVRDDVNLSQIAGKISERGGGHWRAAGSQYPACTVEVIKDYVQCIMEILC